MAETLREHLASVLPEYMVPAVYVRMDKLPVNNIGKIDRRALPEPDSASFITRDYVAPQGESEVALAELWSDLLKIERVGRHDNFLMLGGHSLLAVQMIGRLHCLEYSLSVRTLFDNPVLSVLAASLSKQEKARHVPPNLIATDTTRITPELLPLIDLSQDDIDYIVDCTPGGVANVQDIYGLSPLQDGILFHHMMASKGDPYLLLSCTSFESRDLLDRYLMAFQKVMDRHDILRTAIMWENMTSPAQVVLHRTALSVTELSLDPANGPIIEQVTKLYNSHEYRIKISQAPLIRHSIVQNTDGRWILAQQMHHLVGDHSTLDILEEEIQAFMDGRSESLPAPQPYRNLVAQARLGVSVEEHESFFREMLQDIDTPSLPYGISENHSEDCNFTESHRMLPQELNNKLREHGKRLGVSVASLCHLAWARVIAATSGQTEVVFGTVVFGRMQGGSRSDRTMGLFINTLPFRVNVDDSSVLESVRRVQADLASLLEHEHASLALVQHCSGVPSGMPLFSALLNYRHNTTAFNQSRINPGIEVLLDGDCNNYPFVLSVEDFGSSLGLTTQATQPYNPSNICGYMQQALQSLTEAIEYAPETPVQTLQILPAEEYDLMVHSWNNTDASYPSDRCIHNLFEDQVKRGPETIAVMHDDRSMTYRTLNNHANYLVHRLVGFGIKPGDNIAIQLPRSFELIIVQLAILKVGAAYVPIDMEAPVDRQAYIMSDSDAKLLITEEDAKIPMGIQTPLLRFTADQEKLVDVKDMLDSPERIPVSSLDTAYIMYTSGSTGRPKGVMVSHRGIANLAVDNGFVDFDSSDRVAFSSNPSFDPSTFEVWAPLLNGASIVIIDRDTFLDPHSLAEALIRHQVTFLHMTNALLHQYAFIIGDTLSNLKYLTGAAEQGSIKAYLNVLQHGGPVRLLNRYGPTETTVDATTYLVTGTISQLDRLPIGRPIKNTRLYVLDKSLNPVPTGVVGELHIGGPGVANGYLNRPDLTAERFLPDPFSNHKCAHMYKTGDLVRYLPDGNIVFLGRSDDQVKIRENMAQTLREHLAAVLSEYMIPSGFVHLDTMPLTSNGKIDRRALLVPDRTSFVSQKYVAPKGDTEVALAELWSELLKIARVGRHDNFFMLGGHSLLAMRMIGSIRSSLRLEIKLQALFTSPTIAELAQKLLYSANSEDNEYGVLLPLKTKGSLPPLFCIHPGLGLSWQYVDFAKHLHPEQPLYGLQARGLDGKTPLASSVEEMTLDYLDHIRKVQPHGPYHLLGWSFGGTVAHNIAVELEKHGENVPLLVLMDSTVDQSSLDSDDKLSEHDAVNLLFARLKDKDSAGNGLALWKRTSPIAFNNAKMAKRFTPLVFSGDILIFRATVPQNENAPLIDPTSWSPYTLGEIQVHDVECSHVEMDNPESIALIGSVVAASIEELMR
ncbi:hypothetical protein BG000_004123 [Podila horticola]|nr:hypothetical protein BG000_004123 [Podila horticola]